MHEFHIFSCYTEDDMLFHSPGIDSAPFQQVLLLAHTLHVLARSDITDKLNEYISFRLAHAPQFTTHNRENTVNTLASLSILFMFVTHGTYFFLCPLCFFPYSRLSSYLLRLFLYLISFLLFPCASVWVNTRA